MSELNKGDILENLNKLEETHIVMDKYHSPEEFDKILKNKRIHFKNITQFATQATFPIYLIKSFNSQPTIFLISTNSKEYFDNMQIMR